MSSSTEKVISNELYKILGGYEGPYIVRGSTKCLNCKDRTDNNHWLDIPSYEEWVKCKGCNKKYKVKNLKSE